MGERKRGVFWLIDDEILAVPYEDDAEVGVAKSGNNYNHKLLWEHVRPRKCNKPFDYYPRGRVEFTTRGEPVIYLNSNIGEQYITEVMEIFGITDAPKIHYDGSNHYKSHFDRE